jgi:replicative DNA helicase
VRRERFPIGIPTLDQRLHLGRGQVAVVAGRPSMGKSALAQQWATASARRGFSVVYISLEMPARLIAERHAAQLYGVPWREYATRAPTAQEVASISMAARDWADLGIRVDDRPGPTVDQLARALRTAHRRRPIDLFVVDHIGLVSLGRASRYEGMTAVSNGLLALAKELNAGAILLSQLSRAHTGRAGSDAGIPRLSDLRDSGAVEQDADIVVGVWRPSMDNPEDPAPDVLSVLKDRSGGSISRVPSLFDGPRQLWTERDLTRPDDGEDW